MANRTRKFWVRAAETTRLDYQLGGLSGMKIRVSLGGPDHSLQGELEGRKVMLHTDQISRGSGRSYRNKRVTRGVI